MKRALARQCSALSKPLVLGLAATLVSVLVAFRAAAAGADLPERHEEETDARREREAPSLYHPTGMAEFGLGWLLLPGAKVCVEPTIAGCSSGDMSLELEAWQLFRLHPKWAAGAGIVLGLTPTTDAPRQDPVGVNRDHTRRYFSVEGILRYYLVQGGSFETWAGLTSGLVVVSDRFESTAGDTDKALVGPRGVTIRTEGFTVGLAAGVAFLLSQSWSLGGSVRYGSWFLPQEPNRDPFGDEASLRGQVNVFSLGVNVGYRLPL